MYIARAEPTSPLMAQTNISIMFGMFLLLLITYSSSEKSVTKDSFMCLHLDAAS